MLALSLFLATLVPSHPRPSHCEELGRRLDGTYVTICDGAVARVRDDRGNSRQWQRSSGTIIVRATGAAPMIIAAGRP
jgi:hypothetical protein